MQNLTAVFIAGESGAIIYENGASVSTAFLTNMAGDLKNMGIRDVGRKN